MFPEQISLENSDLLGFRIAGDQGLPHGLTGANTYQFRGMPGDDEMAQFRRDAAHAAAALALPPGAPAGAVMPGPVAVAAAPAPVAAPVVPPGEEEVWAELRARQNINVEL